MNNKLIQTKEEYEKLISKEIQIIDQTRIQIDMMHELEKKIDEVIEFLPRKKIGGLSDRERKMMIHTTDEIKRMIRNTLGEKNLDREKAYAREENYIDQKDALKTAPVDDPFPRILDRILAKEPVLEN